MTDTVISDVVPTSFNFMTSTIFGSIFTEIFALIVEQNSCRVFHFCHDSHSVDVFDHGSSRHVDKRTFRA